MNSINSQLLIYKSPNGEIKIDVHLEDETVWLTQDQMAELFNRAKSTINEHIKKKFGNSEFQQKTPNFYNLDVIISVKGILLYSPIIGLTKGAA